MTHPPWLAGQYMTLVNGTPEEATSACERIRGCLQELDALHHAEVERLKDLIPAYKAWKENPGQRDR